MHDDTRQFRCRGPRSKACLVPLILLALLPCGASIARAAGLSPCQGASLQGYKILLDDISFTPPTADLSYQMNVLRLRLHDDLQKLKQEFGTTIKAVRCEGRQPSGESDFSQGLLDVLQGKLVVLEIWGSVSDQKALVSYLMIPVRPDERGVYGFYQVQYTIDKTGSVHDLFKERSELPVLGLLSMALYNLTLKNGPAAYGLLTKAALWLKKDPNPDAGLVDYVRKLQEEARQLSCQSTTKNLACGSPRGGRP